MIAPARRAATDVLLAVDAGRHDLPTALAQAHAGLADARDRALLTELATGVQRWRLALDFSIHALTGKQPGDLDPEVRTTLRLGVYQLWHATRTPASAVVHDAVEIVKRGPRRSASGMVNAVLRRVAREGMPRLPESPRVPVDDPRWRSQALAYLAIAHSHPAWLVERWLDRFGYDATEAWVRYDNMPADVTVWRTDGATHEDVEGTPTRYVPGGLTLTSGRDAIGLVATGRVYAQDEASAAVGFVAASVARGRVLDACAAPGGKTLAMAPRTSGGVKLIASDLRARRVALLAQTLGRAQQRHVAVLRSDASRLPFEGSLDTVLIDAPCSGLGTLRRDPDVRWRRTAADLPALVATQRALIEEGLRAMRPGGALIYATCSSEPEENESLVTDVLRDHPDLARVDLRQVGLPSSMTPLLTADGALRTWPHVHGLDAFHAVALRVAGKIED